VHAVEIAQVDAFGANEENALHGIDAVHVQAQVATRTAADQRRRRVERTPRARLPAGLQHEIACLRHLLPIGGFHSSLANCRNL
jgi:hypothetical protein